MPVRKIPKSFRAVTGRFPSVINGRCVSYESKLERDYFLRLEFDPTVKSYEEQPVKISGKVNGKAVTYILDCLVHFSNGRRSLLIELKYEEELEEKVETLDLKFLQARKYAKENNYDFEVVTEKQIYDTAFDNYDLIYQFSRRPESYKKKSPLIIERLKQLASVALGELLHSISEERLVQADYLPVIWHMLFTREILADLNSPVDYNSELRLAHGDKNFT